MLKKIKDIDKYYYVGGIEEGWKEGRKRKRICLNIIDEIYETVDYPATKKALYKDLGIEM